MSSLSCGEPVCIALRMRRTYLQQPAIEPENDADDAAAGGGGVFVWYASCAKLLLFTYSLIVKHIAILYRRTSSGTWDLVCIDEFRYLSVSPTASGLVGW